MSYRAALVAAALPGGTVASKKYGHKKSDTRPKGIAFRYDNHDKLSYI